MKRSEMTDTLCLCMCFCKMYALVYVCKPIITDVIFSNYTLLQSKQWEKAMNIDPGRIEKVGFDFAGKGASVF